MTVQTNTTVATGIGNGVTSVFPIPFKFNRAEDLIVYLVIQETEEEIPLTLHSDYTVTGAGNENGGNLTMLAGPLPVGQSVVAQRIVDLRQLTDLRNQGRFFAEVHEDVFDKLVMIDQQQQTQLDRAMLVDLLLRWNALFRRIINVGDPVADRDAAHKRYVDQGDIASRQYADSRDAHWVARTLRSADPLAPLPGPESRAGRLLSFDSSGRPIVVAPEPQSATELAMQLADPAKGAAMVAYGEGNVAEELDKIAEQVTHDLSPVFLEQFLTGFYGRGMLASETPSVITEQPVTANALAGAAIISVADNSMYQAGGCLSVLHDNGLYGTYFITGLGGAGATVSILPALRYDCSVGSAKVERTWYNQPHPGKFYMRLLAQRIANTPEYLASMPQRGRTLFTQLDSAPTDINDLMTGVGGGVVSYFDELNLGQNVINRPVEFNIGRSAFISVGADGDGARTNMIPVAGETQCILRFVAMCRSSAASVEIRVVDNHGRTSVVRALPSGVSQTIPQVYTFPFKLAGDATAVEVRFIATSVPSATAVIVDQIEIFESELSSRPLIPEDKSCTVVLVGDSWVTGDATQGEEREGIWVQLEKERPRANIIDAGVGGDNLTKILARFDADVAPHNPQYVVVNTGTNDSYSPSSGTFFPNAVNNFIYDYNRLITKIQGIGAKPIIIGVPGLAEVDGARTDWLLNDRAKTYSRYFYKNWALRKKVAPEILGIVSQSGGSPTGAIFEKGGSAATGYWTKYADGRLEAVRTVTVDLTSTDSATFDYPVASIPGFATGNATILTVGSSTTYAAHATHTMRCTDTAWIYKIQTAGTVANETIRLWMTGRWY